MILSALGAAGVAGFVLNPSTASAHPYEPVPVDRPVHEAHYHHHHQPWFGVRLVVPAPVPVVVARPVVPAPVVLVPAPVCPPTPLVVPFPR
jgi:hypothetical protein